jgi:hypothetical protein
MAITKTSPPPQMTVGDYRKAALRHLNTCKLLWRYVNLPANSNLKRLPEDEILQNIFYLTGYIVECAIKYRYLTDCYALTDTHNEPYWISINVNIKKHFAFVSTHNKDKTWSEQTVQRLCASAVSRTIPIYLKTLGNVSIPSTGPSVEEVMQGSWEPPVRYLYSTNGLPLPPNRTDIEAFYQATIDLLHNLAIL